MVADVQKPLVVLLGVTQVTRRHGEVLGLDEVRQRVLVHKRIDVRLLNGLLAGVFVLLASLLQLGAARIYRGKGARQLGGAAAELGGGREAARLSFGQLLLVGFQLAGGLLQLALQRCGLIGQSL